MMKYAGSQTSSWNHTKFFSLTHQGNLLGIVVLPRSLYGACKRQTSRVIPFISLKLKRSLISVVHSWLVIVVEMFCTFDKSAVGVVLWLLDEQIILLSSFKPQQHPQQHLLLIWMFVKPPRSAPPQKKKKSNFILYASSSLDKQNRPFFFFFKHNSITPHFVSSHYASALTDCVYTLQNNCVWKE